MYSSVQMCERIGTCFIVCLAPFPDLYEMGDREREREREEAIERKRQWHSKGDRERERHSKGEIV